MHPPETPFTFVLAGAGRVGTAVAAMLQKAGHRPLAIASRTDASASNASDRVHAPVSSFEELPDADVVLIGASDDAIALVAESVRFREGAVLCHLAGSLGLEPFEAARSRGARAAALHPVQACPSVEAALERLPGSAWGVTCDDDVSEWAHRTISEDLHGTPVDVAGEARPRWHAASVVTANGISALLAAGERLAASAGAPDPAAVLGPLAAGAVANARAEGGSATLTGPIVRGEIATIERHVNALRGDAALDSYRLASFMILGSAVASGRIDPGVAARMETILRGSE